VSFGNFKISKEPARDETPVATHGGVSLRRSDIRLECFREHAVATDMALSGPKGASIAPSADGGRSEPQLYRLKPQLGDATYVMVLLGKIPCKTASDGCQRRFLKVRSYLPPVPGLVVFGALPSSMRPSLRRSRPS